MDVGGWLRGLGLGRYEEKLRENKIDFDVLADLTDGDLQELGVPLGDRRRLLRAIGELGAQQPLTTQARPTPSASAPAQSFAQLDSAERRPITVMFCDLVGSTELAAALDVEDWRNLLNSYLDEASRAVIALGGHVLKKLGDGMMAVFGYPRALENIGADLGDFARFAERVEPRRQRLPKRRRNRLQAARLAALEQKARDLLDEQRHAAYPQDAIEIRWRKGALELDGRPCPQR